MATTITIIREGYETVGRKERGDAMRASMRFIGDRHHQRYKPLKFKDSATKRYGLKPRGGEPGSGTKYQGSYTEAKARRGVNGQKRRAIGETKPFVWSGGSRASAAASRKVVAKATSTRGSSEVVINVPIFNIGGSSKRINLNEEFRRVAETERKEQETAGAKKYDRELSRAPRKTTRVRGR